MKTDEAEERIIDEVRRMGNEVLTGRAESRVEKSGETPRRRRKQSAAVKKSTSAHDVRCKNVIYNCWEQAGNKKPQS